MNPEHIAILTGSISTDVNGNPVIVFYAQPADDRVVFADVLQSAVEVRTGIILAPKCGHPEIRNSCLIRTSGFCLQCNNPEIRKLL